MLKPEEIPVGSAGSVAPFCQFRTQIIKYLFYCFPLSLSGEITFLRVLHNVYNFSKNQCTLKSLKKKEVFTRKFVL